MYHTHGAKSDAKAFVFNRSGSGAVQSPFMGIAPRLNSLDIYSSNEAYRVSSDILYGHLLFIGVFYDW